MNYNSYRYVFRLLIIVSLIISGFNVSTGQFPKRYLQEAPVNIKILLHLLRDLEPAEIDTTLSKMGFKYYKKDSALIRGTQNFRQVANYINQSKQHLAVSIENGSIHSVIYYYINFSAFLYDTKSLGYSFISVQNGNGFSDSIYSNGKNAIIFTQNGENETSCSVLISKIP